HRSARHGHHRRTGDAARRRHAGTAHTAWGRRREWQSLARRRDRVGRHAARTGHGWGTRRTARHPGRPRSGHAHRRYASLLHLGLLDGADLLQDAALDRLLDLLAILQVVQQPGLLYLVGIRSRALDGILVGDELELHLLSERPRLDDFVRGCGGCQLAFVAV